MINYGFQTNNKHSYVALVDPVMKLVNLFMVVLCVEHNTFVRFINSTYSLNHL